MKSFIVRVFRRTTGTNDIVGVAEVPEREQRITIRGLVALKKILLEHCGETVQTLVRARRKLWCGTTKRVLRAVLSTQED